MLDIIKDIVRVSCRIRRQTGTQPTAEELAKALRVPLPDISRHLEIAKGLISLDGAIPDDGGEELAVDGLTPREELLLCLRFEINMGGDRALESIGQSLLETRGRIRALEAKALRKLKPPNGDA